MLNRLTNDPADRSHVARQRKTVATAVGRYKATVESLGLYLNKSHLEAIERIREAPKPSMEATRRIAALERQSVGLTKETKGPRVYDLLDHPVARGPMDPVARSYLNRQIELMENGGVTWADLERILATLGRFIHYTTPEQGGWVSHRSRPGSKVDEGGAVVDHGTNGSPRPAQVHLDYLRDPRS